MESFESRRGEHGQDNEVDETIERTLKHIGNEVADIMNNEEALRMGYAERAASDPERGNNNRELTVSTAGRLADLFRGLGMGKEGEKLAKDAEKLGEQVYNARKVEKVTTPEANEVKVTKTEYVTDDPRKMGVNPVVVKDAAKSVDEVTPIGDGIRPVVVKNAAKSIDEVEPIRQDEEKSSWDEYISAALSDAEQGKWNWMSPEEKAAMTAEIAKRNEKVREVQKKVHHRSGFRKAFRVAAAAAILTGVVGIVGAISYYNRSDASPMLINEKPEKPKLTTVLGTAESALDEDLDGVQGSAGEGDSAKSESLLDDERLSQGDILENMQEYDNLKVALGDEILAKYVDGKNRQELENGTTGNLDDYANLSEKSGWYAFGTSIDHVHESLLKGEVSPTIEALMKINASNPYALASTISGSPLLMEGAGFGEEIINIQHPGERARAIVKSFLGEDGGVAQRKALGALYLALTNENTEITSEEVTEQRGTFAISPVDRSKGFVLDNLQVFTNKTEREHVRQIKIAMNYMYKGEKRTDIMYINTYCGGQPDYLTFKTVNEKGETVITTVDLPPDIDKVDVEEDIEWNDEWKPVIPDKPEEKPEDEVIQKNAESIIENGSYGLGEGNAINWTQNIDTMTEEQKAQVGDGQIDASEITGNTTGTYEATTDPTATYIFNGNELVPESQPAGQPEINTDDEQPGSNQPEGSIPDSQLNAEEQARLQAEIAAAEARAAEAAANTPAAGQETDDYLQSLLNGMNNNQ